MGYIIHIGGQRILHAGDAQINEACFEPLAEFAKGVDVACLPHWLVERPAGVAFVRDVLQPKHLLICHIMPRDAEKIVAGVKESFPKATCLTKRMMRAEF